MGLSSQHLSECLGAPSGGSQGLWACNTQGWVIAGHRVRRGPLWGSPSAFHPDSLPQEGGHWRSAPKTHGSKCGGSLRSPGSGLSSLRGTALSCFVTNSLGDFGKALPSPTMFCHPGCPLEVLCLHLTIPLGSLKKFQPLSPRSDQLYHHFQGWSLRVGFFKSSPVILPGGGNPDLRALLS